MGANTTLQLAYSIALANGMQADGAYLKGVIDCLNHKVKAKKPTAKAKAKAKKGNVKAKKAKKK